MKNITHVILFLLVGACLAFCIWIKATTPKIAFVRSSKVVDGYMGMKEAQNLYKSKVDQWQANLDTLNYDFERSYNDYNSALPKLSIKDRAAREEALKRQKDNIENYASSVEKKAAEEEEKMVQGALNQVNSFISDYAKKNGYDIVLGVTKGGNILYGTDAIDVTDDVLKGLNDNYKK